ncbi:MAG: hypothetical protein K6G69_01890 [Lachnospiraceae bacterium]|nr:hypothetical protein [Lachnospiraceae bacterium]
MANKRKAGSVPTYDDVHKTLATDCSQLLIPLINEVFGTHYKRDTGNELLQQELMYQTPRKTRRRAVDSVISLEDDDKRKHVYHVESESKAYGDGIILIRIYEYDFKLAEKSITFSDDRKTIDVDFPQTAVIFLRGTDNPEKLFIHLRSEAGDMHIPVRTVSLNGYSIDELFEKRLYFLIPFHIFVFEKELKIYNEDEEKLESLKAYFKDIYGRLEMAYTEGLLDSNEVRSVINMTAIVIDRISDKWSNVRKGIGDIMGGRVIEDYPAKNDRRMIIQQRIELKEKDNTIMELQEAYNSLQEDNNSLKESYKNLLEEVERLKAMLMQS